MDSELYRLAGKALLLVTGVVAFLSLLRGRRWRAYALVAAWAAWAVWGWAEPHLSDGPLLHPFTEAHFPAGIVVFGLGAVLYEVTHRRIRVLLRRNIVFAKRHVDRVGRTRSSLDFLLLGLPLAALAFLIEALSTASQVAEVVFLFGGAMSILGVVGLVESLSQGRTRETQQKRWSRTKAAAFFLIMMVALAAWPQLWVLIHGSTFSA